MTEGSTQVRSDIPRSDGLRRILLRLVLLWKVGEPERKAKLPKEPLQEALYEIASMRRFAGLEMWDEALPDESAILRFRHLLEKHKLTEKLLGIVNAHLTENKLLLRTGTIVDATLIAAPSSTKNASGKRDAEMSSTKKGNNWYFGMKVHSGVDAESELVCIP